MMLPVYLTENETFEAPAGTVILPWGTISYEEVQLLVWSRANVVLEGTWMLINVSMGAPIDLTLIYSKVIKYGTIGAIIVIV